jgi:DNA-binding transcriptional ArsR family regulator
MERSIFDIQADFCKAMGNATRLQILHILRERPLIVNEIVAQTGFSQSMVSRQLSALRSVGVVECQRHGTEMLYQLSDSQIGEVCDLVRKVLLEQMKKRSNVLFPSEQ